MKDDLIKALPTDEQVLDSYNKEKAWQDYKKDVTMSVVNMDKLKLTNRTTLKDVPKSIRDNTVRYETVKRSYYTLY